MTGTWTEAGEFPAADAAHLDGYLVLLANGHALVAGGASPELAATSTTALFDPAIMKWTVTAPLIQGRRLHTVTRLPNGKVLAAGGAIGTYQWPFVSTASAELYDPSTGKWTATNPMTETRWGHSATLLRDGRVLVAGGGTTRSPSTTMSRYSAEVYDPASGHWTAIAPMTDPRSFHQAVPLDDGRVLILGGGIPNGYGTMAASALCELFDPATGTWSPTGSLGSARIGAPATKLSDGTIFVTGSWNSGLVDRITSDAHSSTTTERYDPATGQWTPDEPMPTGRAAHQAVLLTGGEVLVIGGCDTAVINSGFRSVLLYNPSTRTWRSAAGLHTGRWEGAAARLPDGRVLAVGGLTKSDDAGRFEGENIPARMSEVFSL